MDDVWRENFLRAFRHCFDGQQEKLMMHGILLEDVRFDEAGILRVVYRHPLLSGTTGLIREFDSAEVSEAPDELATNVAAFDVSEPLGNYEKLLSPPDERGIRWWSAEPLPE